MRIDFLAWIMNSFSTLSTQNNAYSQFNSLTSRAKLISIHSFLFNLQDFTNTFDECYNYNIVHGYYCSCFYRRTKVHRHRLNSINLLKQFSMICCRMVRSVEYNCSFHEHYSNEQNIMSKDLRDSSQDKSDLITIELEIIFRRKF